MHEIFKHGLWLARVIWSVFAFLGMFILLALVIENIWSAQAAATVSTAIIPAALFGALLKVEIFDR
jgi:hypothetical protein